MKKKEKEMCHYVYKLQFACISYMVCTISYLSVKFSRNKARSLKPSLMHARISLCTLRRVKNSYYSLSPFILVFGVDSFEGRCVIQMKCVSSSKPNVA